MKRLMKKEPTPIDLVATAMSEELSLRGDIRTGNSTSVQRVSKRNNVKLKNKSSGSLHNWRTT